MTRWEGIDERGIHWLREHPWRVVRLERLWLQRLKSLLDLRIATPLSRTKFGEHLQEYRERIPKLSLHVREFRGFVTVHADLWNPDWSLAYFVVHCVVDVVGEAMGMA
ncbi:MAG: hypothetical protein HYY16_09595 [Planctomycetes bacterium]|nr:hypothetical protein [Planctomycetota bacterium]